MEIKPFIFCAALLTLVGCADSYESKIEKVDSRLAAFEKSPSEKNLRKLVSISTDGASMYTYLAALGKAFAAEPKIFETVSNDLRTERERRMFGYLADWGNGVFEYNLDWEPENFDQVYAEQKWLTKFKRKETSE